MLHIFFISRGVRYAIDATPEPPETDKSNFGRLINHSRQKKEINVCPKVFVDNNDIPRLYFVADRKILPGEQLLYDYGERRTYVLKENPWLKKLKSSKSKLASDFIDNEAEVSGEDSGDNDQTEHQVTQEDIDFINDDNNLKPEPTPPNPYMDKCLKHADGFVHSDCADCNKTQHNILSKVINRKERQIISLTEIESKRKAEIFAEARRTEDSLMYRDLKDKQKQEKAEIKQKRLAELFCDSCNIQCYTEQYFQKHLQSAKHKEKTEKPAWSTDTSSNSRYCNTCKLSISKNNWAAHCKTKKHSAVNKNKSAARTSVYNCNYCNIEVGYVSKARHTKSKTHLRNISQSLVEHADVFSLVTGAQTNQPSTSTDDDHDNVGGGEQATQQDQQDTDDVVEQQTSKAGIHFLLEFGTCVKYKICRKIVKPGTYKQTLKDRVFNSFASIFQSICVTVLIK